MRGARGRGGDRERGDWRPDVAFALYQYGERETERRGGASTAGEIEMERRYRNGPPNKVWGKNDIKGNVMKDTMLKRIEV